MTIKIPEPKGFNPVDMPWARAVTDFIRSQQGEQATVNSALQNLNQSQAGIFTAIEYNNEQIAEVGEKTGVSDDVSVGVPTAPILATGLAMITANWDGQYVPQDPEPLVIPNPERIGYMVAEASLTLPPPFDPEVGGEPVDPFVPVGTPFRSLGTTFAGADIGAAVGDTVYVRFRSVKAGTEEGFVGAHSSIVLLGVEVPDVSSEIIDSITSAQQKADEAWAAAEVAVIGQLVEYAVNSSETVPPTTGWSPNTPVRTPGTFIWMRTTLTYGDGTSSTTNPVLLTGNDGADGTTGRGIASTAVTYQASSSGTVTPTGTWLSSPPAVTAGQFLWTRTVITYTDSTTSTSYSVGSMGQNGSAGKGVSGSVVTYQAGSSGTTPPTGAWTSTVPAVTAGQYLWTRTVTTYTDATSTTAYSVGRQGQNGATGVGVSSITIYYRTEPTGSTAPAAPTTSPPPAPWATGEPAYIPNVELWSVTRVVYSNGTFAYSTVNKVSAYAAAAEAAQAALEAQTTADGKNRIYLSPTVPPALPAELKLGDLWYVQDVETATLSEIRSWNGFNWVPYRIVADSIIVPGSVGDISLMDGAISGQKVKARTFTGEHMEIGSVSVNELTPNIGSVLDITINPSVADMQNDLEQQQRYYRFDSEGLKIGDPATNEELRLNPGRIEMVQSGNVPTYWEAQTFYVERMIVEAANIGAHRFEKYASGRTIIRPL